MNGSINDHSNSNLNHTASSINIPYNTYSNNLSAHSLPNRNLALNHKHFDPEQPSSKLVVSQTKKTNSNKNHKLQRHVNNVSLDVDTTSNSIPSIVIANASDLTNSSLNLNDDNSVSNSHLIVQNKKVLKKVRPKQQQQQQEDLKIGPGQEQEDLTNKNEELSLNNNDYDEGGGSLMSSINTGAGDISSSTKNNSSSFNQTLNSEKIQNEIEKLIRKQSYLNMQQPQNQSQNTPNTYGAASMISSSIKKESQELVADALNATKHFDRKIEHIETYSQIIENATRKMDACVNDMNIVYQNYENIYDASSADEEFYLQYNSQKKELEVEKQNKAEEEEEEEEDQPNVYDLNDLKKQLIESAEGNGEIKNVKDIKENGMYVSTTSLNSNKTNLNNEETASQNMDRLSMTSSTHKFSFKGSESENYLDDSDSLNMDDVKQEIKYVIIKLKKFSIKKAKFQHIHF
jgi:hypothetical protein